MTGGLEMLENLLVIGDVWMKCLSNLIVNILLLCQWLGDHVIQGWSKFVNTRVGSTEIILLTGDAVFYAILFQM